MELDFGITRWQCSKTPAVYSCEEEDILGGFAHWYMVQKHKRRSQDEAQPHELDLR